jgi:hypothetical protein
MFMAIPRPCSAREDGLFIWQGQKSSGDIVAPASRARRDGARAEFRVPEFRHEWMAVA